MAWPVVVVGAVVAHIARCEPTLQALYAYDPDAALGQARTTSTGDAFRVRYSAASSLASSWCRSATNRPSHCHDTAAMSLAATGELAHKPFRPFFDTATCAGLKM